jgi:hypothetical protein
MTLTTKPQPLVLPGESPPKLRYSPLPALDVADYVNDYIDHLGQTGVFDYLSTQGLGLDVDAVRRLDLSAIGIVGSAFSRLLSGDGGVERKRLSYVALDHAQRFKVQAWDAETEDWVAVSDAASFNRFFAAEHLIDLVRVLGGEALRPLWNRLASQGGAKPSESATNSDAPALAS